jgi:molybdenum-dependent DNA-binding transcriptional regulator ModE
MPSGEDILEAYKHTGSLKGAGKLLSCSHQSVLNYLNRVGALVPRRPRSWTTAETDLLIALYASKSLADALAIERELEATRPRRTWPVKASSLGLARRHSGTRSVTLQKRAARNRLTVEREADIIKAYQSTGSVHRAAIILGTNGDHVAKHLKRLNVPVRNQEWTAAEDALLRELYATVHAPDINFIAKVLHKTRPAVAVRASRLGLTDARKGPSPATHAKMVARHLSLPHGTYPHVKHGRRADMGGQFFRSAWEANVARYLTFTGRQWQFEATTFWFLEIQRGVRSYTPDFFLPDEDMYIEVKGYMDARSRTKLNRMRIYYPKVRLEVWDAARYHGIRTTAGLIIPHWE